MEKTITLSVIGSEISIKQIEDRDFFIVNEIELPDEKPYESGGIWEDEAIFFCGKETEDYKLRLPINVLMGILESTKKLVEDSASHWWNNQQEVHTTLKEIFRTDEVSRLKKEVEELKEKLEAKKKK